eukprot:3852758-Prymnesium_polylepis.2
MEPLHWSLPEIAARKKHACFATPASVMWLPNSVTARERASILARSEQIWSVTVSRESVARSSASDASVLQIGERAAASSSGRTCDASGVR